MLCGANSAADTLLGVNHRELIGKSLDVAFPHLGETGLPARYRDVCRTGEPFSVSCAEHVGGRVQGAFEVHAFRVAPDKLAVTFFDVSEREKTTRALRASEGKLRAIVDTSTVGIIVTRVDRTCEQVNRAAAIMFGYQPDEMLGLKLDSLVHPDDLPRALRLHHELVDGNTSGGSVGLRYVSKDGTLFWGSVWVSVLRDDAGLPSNIVVVITDVTEEKLAKEQLATSRALYQELVENINEVVFSVDEKGVISGADRDHERLR